MKKICKNSIKVAISNLTVHWKRKPFTSHIVMIFVDSKTIAIFNSYKLYVYVNSMKIKQHILSAVLTIYIMQHI